MKKRDIYDRYINIKQDLFIKMPHVHYHPRITNQNVRKKTHVQFNPEKNAINSINIHTLDDQKYSYNNNCIQIIFSIVTLR